MIQSDLHPAHPTHYIGDSRMGVCAWWGGGVVRGRVIIYFCQFFITSFEILQGFKGVEVF